MFLQEPLFAVGSRFEWTLTRALIYHSPLIGGTISAPVGFNTDLASIPRFFHRLFPVNDTHRLAAVLHDYLYSKKGAMPDRTLTRLQCDQIFLEAMRVSGVPEWKAQTMYKAVRLFGSVYWNKK
jgi:hypothetical protein